MKLSSLLTTTLLSGFITSSVLANDDPPAIPERASFLVFLLAGQSNMAGRGDLAEADPDINPQVLMLAKDGSWQYAMDPVHFDKKIAGAGLARAFAAEILKHEPNVTIGLVPAAVGGTSIDVWEPGAFNEKTASHPYDDAIARTQRAIQDGTLAGILWHQGEGDSGKAKSALYKARLIALIERFRKEFDAPELPFIIGQLGQFEAKPWSPGRIVVNDAQIAVAREVSNTAFVSSDDLVSKGDNTHFNTASLHEFGRRYAEAYLQLTQKQQ